MRYSRALGFIQVNSKMAIRRALGFNKRLHFGITACACLDTSMANLVALGIIQVGHKKITQNYSSTKGVRFRL